MSGNSVVGISEAIRPRKRADRVLPKSRMSESAAVAAPLHFSEFSMSDNQTPAPQPSAPEIKPEGVSLSTVVTMGVASAVIAFSASLLTLHFFPQMPPVEHPVAVVDMVKIATAVTKMTLNGEAGDEALVHVGERLIQLRDAGYIILDARSVIATPDMYILKPSELIPGVSDEGVTGAGYMPPNLFAPVPGAPQTTEPEGGQ